MILAGAPPPEDSAPGWKTDPLGGTKCRYWDGSSWTFYVRSSPSPAGPRKAPAHTPYAPKAEQAKEEGPYASDDEGRIRRSWRLTTIAWNLLRSDQTCLLLAVVGVAFATLATSLILYLGGYFHDLGHSGGHLALVALIALYPSTLISVFFNVALAKAAGAALEGQPISVKEALAASLRRLDQIALWSLIAATVGLLLQQIASRLPFGGKLATWLVGAAWGLGTMFVVPILALEPNAAALPSIRLSGQLLRKRWGEGIAGTLTIAFWVAVVAIPLGCVLGFAAAAARYHPQTWAAIAGVDLMAIVVIGAVAAALRQVFTVALYKSAVGGSAGGFPLEDLERPFAGRNTRSTLRWVGFSVAAFLALLIAAAIVIGPSERSRWVPSHGYFQAAYSPQVHVGMPVAYRGQKVGSVVAADQDAELFTYHLRQDRRALGYHRLMVSIEGQPTNRFLELTITPLPADRLFRAAVHLAHGAQIHIGMPVIYRGKQIGAVIDRWDQGGKPFVVYQLRQRFEAVGRRPGAVLEGSRGDGFLELNPSRR